MILGGMPGKLGFHLDERAREISPPASKPGSMSSPDAAVKSSGRGRMAPAGTQAGMGTPVTSVPPGA
jgi:hypothetical protein